MTSVGFGSLLNLFITSMIRFENALHLKANKRWFLYLLFADRQTLSIEVISLEVAEQQLDWTGVIRVRASENHVDAKVLNMLLDIVVNVIARPVQQQYAALSP